MVEYECAGTHGISISNCRASRRERSPINGKRVMSLFSDFGEI
jgi:hypothetical protein